MKSSDDPSNQTDPKPKNDLPWYRDWYPGVITLCLLNILPGTLWLCFEKTPLPIPIIEPLLISIWILGGLYMLWLFAAENLSRDDMTANLAALLFSLSSVLAAILLFASRYKLYGLRDTLNNGHAVNDPWSAIYFSIITWTTVGYGDLVPSIPSRIYATCEATLSYLYMALLLAQIVNLAKTGTSKP